MEYLVAILGILGALVIYFKKQANTAATNEKLAKTRAKDEQLKEAEQVIMDAIDELDKGINRVKEERAAAQRKADEDNMSLKERAERLRNGLK